VLGCPGNDFPITLSRQAGIGHRQQIEFGYATQETANDSMIEVFVRQQRDHVWVFLAA